MLVQKHSRLTEMVERDTNDTAKLEGLSGKVARGAAWVAGGGFAIRIIGLVNTLIIARLLVPEDFGVVAIGVTITQLLQNFSDIGVSQAVVRYADAGRKELDTLFTLSLARGLAVGALLLALAGTAGTFYDDPRVTGVFAGMTVVALLQSLVNPKFHEFQRELNFYKEFLANIIDKIAAVSVSIAIALLFRNYWAIIGGLVAGGFAKLIASYALRPYMPSLGLPAFRRLFGFTGWLTGVSFFAALNNKLDALVLGRLLGTGPTGIYTMGVQLAWLPGSELSGPVARAVFPGLAALRGEPERMRRALLSGSEALATIAMPAAIGAALIADDLVSLLLGDQWLEAAIVVQVYAPVVALISAYALVYDYMIALGRTRLAFFREGGFFLIRLPLFIWAAANFGLEGAVWALAVLGLVQCALYASVYMHLTRRSPFEPLWRARRSFISAGVMALLLWSLSQFTPFIGDAPLPARLTINIGVGAAAYCGSLYLLWRIAGEPEGAESRLFGMVAKVVSRVRSFT